MKKQSTPEVEVIAGGGTTRATQATAIELAQADNDDVLAWLIHDIALELGTGALSSGATFASATTEVGFSTDQDGNPAKVVATRQLRHLRENTAVVGAHASHEEVDTTPLARNTLWAAPYLVVIGVNDGNYEDASTHKVHLTYSVVTLDDWRTMLKLWNEVDETDDRDAEWWNP